MLLGPKASILTPCDDGSQENGQKNVDVKLIWHKIAAAVPRRTMRSCYYHAEAKLKAVSSLCGISVGGVNVTINKCFGANIVVHRKLANRANGPRKKKPNWRNWSSRRASDGRKSAPFWADTRSLAKTRTAECN